MAFQIAEGLGAVHAKRLVHRDLKPGNIMRDPDGVIHLMDFGIARRVASEGTSVTASGQIIGTPEYMSPEQARGEKVDLRSDIYALGVVVFEMFTGRVPFQGDTPVATILKHLQEPPPLDGPEAAKIPQPLVGVLRTALAKEREERYAGTEEFLGALREAGASSSSGARAAVAERVTQTIRGGRMARGVPTPPSMPVRRSWKAEVAEPRTPARVAPPRVMPSISRVPAGARRALRPAERQLAWLVGVPTAGLLLVGGLLVGYYTLRPSRLPTPEPGATAPPEPPPTSSQADPLEPSPGLSLPDGATTVPATEPIVEPTQRPEDAKGLLRIIVAPWANVSVDGKEVGTTPFNRRSSSCPPVPM